MKHILVIDPLDKLVLKKDSSLLLSLVMKEKGVKVYLMFKQDLAFCNQSETRLKVFDFDGSYNKETFYLDSFKLKNETLVAPDAETTFHMRLDPPVDLTYLRVLWFLEFYEARGSKIVNRPMALAAFNEKFLAYKHPESIPTYVGSSYATACDFVAALPVDCHDLILEPLDLYQGIGVTKFGRNEFLTAGFSSTFKTYIEKYNGHVIVQPFQTVVTKGEIRALYFNGKELGHIKKIPPKDSYLANIAQGASFEAYKLNPVQKRLCAEIALELKKSGVLWIAYDLLGDKVSEVNITCPGLLVEVSKANHVNLAEKILSQL
jgi:glutathione synthase